jgi:hypothetical protein
MPATVKSVAPRIYWTRGRLVWLVPILIASAVFLAIWLYPTAFTKDRVFFPFFIIYGLIAPVGGFWAIHESIRHEKHPWRCVAIVVLVPFGFIWYYFEKYRKRVAQTEALLEAPGGDDTRQFSL